MKTKRIMAILGILLLVALYGSTLVFALMNNPISDDLLKISILLTIVVPVLLYAYQLIFRLTNKKKNPDEPI